ncbi:MAG: flavodoxin [Spirochaetaceae bacterium]|nr:flavodoxin [Spirochaetaceae bacterium]
MKIAIRYYTKTGNTKKLADCIAEVTGAQAITVDNALTEDVDILFLCNSIYGANVDESVKTFLDQNTMKIGQIVNISTSALLRSTYSYVKKIAKEKGLNLSEKEWHCKGEFKIFRAGKPNKDDLASLTKFVKEIIE